MMRETDCFCDRVLVLDPLTFSGLALCALADRVTGKQNSLQARTLAELNTLITRYQDENLLVILDLFSETQQLTDGLRLMAALKTLSDTGRLRLMVCTDQHDPLLLRAVANHGPAVLTVRGESLAVLEHSIRIAVAAFVWQGMVLSPVVSELLSLTWQLRMGAQELEQLLTRERGTGMREAARIMNISYRTLVTFRQTLPQRIAAFSYGIPVFRLGSGDTVRRTA